MTSPAAALPASNPDLEWFYCWSAAEIGLHSPSLDGAAIHSSEPAGHTDQELAAAAKQRRIRAALMQLATRLQAVLEACYEPRPHAVQLRHEHGIAAGWVARNLHNEGAKVTSLHAEVALAHQAFALVHGKPARTRKERAERWLSSEVGAGRWDGAGPCRI